MLYQKEKELQGCVKEFFENNILFEKVIRLIAQDIIDITYGYVGNYEDAKDILQEVFLKLYRKLKFLKENLKFLLGFIE